MTSSNELLSNARRHVAEGQFDPAEVLCRELLKRDPQQVEPLQMLAVICYQQGRLPAAIEFLEKAIDVDSDDSSLHYGLGSISWMAGNVDRAIASYQRALEIDPHNAEIENDLGVAFNIKGLRGEAQSHLQNSLRLVPDQASTLINLANVLRDVGDLDEAVDRYEQALRIEPENFVGHSNFGMALSQLGRFDDAIAHLEQALGLQPRHVPAYQSLGELALCDKYEFSAQQIKQMNVLASDHRLGPDEAAALHFTLGGIWDRQQRYDQAFGAYRQGNDCKHRQLVSRDAAFDIARFHESIDSTIEVFDAQLFEKPRSFGSSSDVPVFVVGMPRSGTTLVQQIISSHPDGAGAGELPEIKQLAKQLPTILNGEQEYPDCIPLADAPAINQLAQQYLNRLLKHGNGAQRIVDKMWSNFHFLGFIALLFPQARVIHCRRDPMDIGLSCFFSYLNNIQWVWILDEIGWYYREYERMMAHWQKVLPLQMHEVQYEQIIAQQAEASRELIAFCGLPWDERCLAFQDRENPVQTASRVQVRQPLYASSVNRSKKYEYHLLPLKTALEGRDD